MKHTIKSARRAGIELHKTRDTWDRPSGAKLSALYLAQNGQEINADAVNETCFNHFFFTLSGNKTQGTSKNAGTGKIFPRLQNYLNRDRALFNYDRWADKLCFTALGKSKLLGKTRSKVSVSTLKKFKGVTFKTRKTVLTKADKKKISTQLVNHLS